MHNIAKMQSNPHNNMVTKGKILMEKTLKGFSANP